jgi:osmotically-inducible protein OsmY
MTTAIKPDVDIQRDVLEVFEWDPQIELADVGVAVDDGVVTLTGTVDSYGEKMAAERAALRVVGVRAVANDLSVRTPRTRTDTDIAKAAAAAIEANSMLPPEAIDVTVQNGKVTLKGTVTWAYQQAAASNCVRYLNGVRDVINQIVIKQPKASMMEIRTGIQRALVRAAEIDAGKINVFTDDGRVRLTGIVRSWAEKQAAAEAAAKAKGVTNVINDIVVRPA